MSKSGENELLTDTLVIEDIEEVQTPLRKPPLYRVVILNDDYTPMDFVVQVLKTFFHMNKEKATQVMLTVHQHGKGECGIYTRDVAETKVSQVNEYARQQGHPLMCEMEVINDPE